MRLITKNAALNYFFNALNSNHSGPNWASILVKVNYIYLQEKQRQFLFNQMSQIISHKKPFLMFDRTNWTIESQERSGEETKNNVEEAKSLLDQPEEEKKEELKTEKNPYFQGEEAVKMKKNLEYLRAHPGKLIGEVSKRFGVSRKLGLRSILSLVEEEKSCLISN